MPDSTVQNGTWDIGSRYVGTAIHNPGLKIGQKNRGSGTHDQLVLYHDIGNASSGGLKARVRERFKE